jgi:hypothetical protein
MVSTNNINLINSWNNPENSDQDRESFKLGPNQFVGLTNQ